MNKQRALRPFDWEVKTKPMGIADDALLGVVPFEVQDKMDDVLWRRPRGSGITPLRWMLIGSIKQLFEIEP